MDNDWRWVLLAFAPLVPGMVLLGTVLRDATLDLSRRLVPAARRLACLLRLAPCESPCS